jgi:glyoxylate reductase
MSVGRVFVTRRIPAEGLEAIRPLAEVDVWQGELPPPREVLLDKARGCAGILCLLTDRIDASVMDAAAGSLAVISAMSVGFDNIDVGAASARGIPVGNTPEVLTETTADFAWALLMAAARRVVEAHAYAAAGRWKTWEPMLLMGSDVFGATLGIVGYGRIGQAVARRAAGYRMQILYNNVRSCPDYGEAPPAECVGFEELLARSDFVTIHTRLSPQTRHLFGDAQFAQMKQGAVLVNTARGPVVDPEALARALSHGRLAAAALDVTEPEPLPRSSPLFALPNLIVTPHVASASIQTRARMAVMAAENLRAGLRGEKLPHCVNPEVYR